jgi:hypothetical protein
MADQPVTAPRPGGWLPTQQANHFSLAMNGSELLLAFGLTRLAMVPTAMGDTPESHVEWVATLSISPTAAVQLAKMLNANISTYEEHFGKIPADPNFKIAQSR